MKRFFAGLVVLTLLLVSFSGCTTELYQQMLITGFGIDKEKDGYRVTARYTSMDEEKGEEQTTVTGKTVYDALNDLSLYTGKKQMYAGAVFIIVGKAVAQESLAPSLDFFIRYFKTRPTIHLYMAAGEALEILETKKEDRLISSDTLLSYSENAQNRGKTATASVMQVINTVKNQGTSAVVPVIQKEGEEINCNTSAVFDEYQLDTELTREETIGYLAGKGILAGASLVAGPKGQISVDIAKTQAKVFYALDGPHPAFTVKMKAQATLASYPMLGKSLSYAEIEKEVSDQLRRYTEAALTKCLAKKSDILSFGYKIFIEQPEYWRPIEKSWNDLLPELPVSVEVQTTVTRIGEEESPPG